jgi:hypothetical protein
MRRLAFNLASALSFLLLIFLTYSWLRSYLPSRMRFESVDGALMILFWEGEGSLDPQDAIYSPSSEKFFGIRSLMKLMGRKSEKKMLGFRSITGGGLFQGVSYHIIAIPFWVLVPLTAILPALWLRARRRHHHRVNFNKCLNCGYDLRQSKENCPECGTPIPTPSPSSPPV